jgi:hypothetical protein
VRLADAVCGNVEVVPAAVTISLPSRSYELTPGDVDRLYEELWRVASCGRRGAVTAASWLRNRAHFQPERTIAFEGDEAEAIGHALARLAVADAVTQLAS